MRAAPWVIAFAALAAAAGACDGIAGIHQHVLESEGGAEGGCADAGLEGGTECVPALGDDGP